MLSELWLFRDSNWSPDFPTSARAAIDLYSISRDVPIDGVLAVNQRAVRLLIQAIGPLRLEGYAEPITGANVLGAARQSWSQGKENGGDWWAHRKDFMAVVFQAAANRLEGNLDSGTLLALSSAAEQALDEKHILAYLQEERAATLISELEWDGSLLDRSGDYLLVVDTNMGFNKANILVSTELEYVVDLTAVDRPMARLAVRHHHPLEREQVSCRHEPRYGETYKEMAERCYWDYLRVYVPSASVLVDATPHFVPASELLSGHPSPAQVQVGPPELGRNVFGTFLLVRPSETIETRFEYALPQDILQIHDGQIEYSLTIQKQPGTKAVPLRARVLFPTGWTVKRSEPPPVSQTGSTLEYAFTLETDRTLSAIFAGDPHAP
jgi:hypothetical protein